MNFDFELCRSLLRDDKVRNSVGDWKFYPCVVLERQHPIRTKPRLQSFLRCTTHRIREGGEHAREVAHLVFLAAAEALLDHTVTKILRDLQIEAPFVNDRFLPNRLFEYIVADPDNSIAANYCEIILANRITQRLATR